MDFSIIFCLVFIVAGVYGRAALDICQRKPTINGLCVSSTLGIYYDAETQHCKFVGCSPDKRLFDNLEDCEKRCNSEKHRRRRVRN